MSFRRRRRSRRIKGAGRRRKRFIKFRGFGRRRRRQKGGSLLALAGPLLDIIKSKYDYQFGALTDPVLKQ